jgi:hypothetical protein
MGDKEVVDKLDTIIGLLHLAFADSLQRARDELLKDRATAAILAALDSASDVPANELMSQVKAAAGQKDRAIQARLANLIAQRIVIRTGAGVKTTYRSSGLISVPARREAVEPEK